MESQAPQPAAPAPPAAVAAPAPSEQVLIKLQAKGAFQVSPNQLKREPNVTIGEVQALLSNKLMRNKIVTSPIHVFITRGSECFIPSPDQTIGNLLALYGQEDFVEKTRVLSLTLSTQIFQG